MCDKCEIENCIACNTKNICQECTKGNYFNQESKKCEPCKNNCL